jgi:hypothetical protein
MKPCKLCDQSGIIYLGNIKAPCLECSSHRNLEDLEHECNCKIASEDRFKEKLMIQEHNKRIRSLEAEKNEVLKWEDK